jgi:hypothetical protein
MLHDFNFGSCRFSKPFLCMEFKLDFLSKMAECSTRKHYIKPLHFCELNTVRISRESPCVGGGGVGSDAAQGQSVLVGGLMGCYWCKTV